MKVGNVEVQAMPHLPSSVDTPTVRLTLGVPPFFAKQLDVSADQARQMAAELMLAADLAEGK